MRYSTIGPTNTMQLSLVTAALVAAVAASPQYVEPSKWGTAKVVNRCSYDVYLWSIYKEDGCQLNDMHTLKSGGVYSEKFRAGKQAGKDESEDNGGISLKLSKYQTCGGKDISQLEYKIKNNATHPEFNGNFLDMSFVDCVNNLEDCPGRTDGFYLVAGGNDKAKYKSAVNNEHCPVFNVYNAAEAARVSYINWDDPQTKWCNQDADLSLYLCGGQAPDADDESPSEPVSSAAPSSEIESTPSPSSTKQQKPKPTPPAPSTTEDAFIVAAAAAVTQAPEAPVAPVIKTEVVYVTEYVNRRHAHGRRHQRYHA